MRSGAVVRALASHQYGPGSNPGVDPIHVCGLSLLLVLVLAPRGFSPCISVFPLLKNKHFQIPFRSGTHGHVSTTSWELLKAPWVKKCQVIIFYRCLICTRVRTRAPVPCPNSSVCHSDGHHFFWPLSQCLKKLFHFHALGNYVYSALIDEKRNFEQNIPFKWFVTLVCFTWKSI